MNKKETRNQIVGMILCAIAFGAFVVALWVGTV